MTTSQLSPTVGKRQYLITYSQADLELFATCESFGTAVAEEFNAGLGKVKVDFWACCKEQHKDGGFHYHCSVKLTGSKKWIGVRNRLSLKYSIQVHFSDSHDFCPSSYRYVCKEDQDVFHSVDHPMGLLSTSLPPTNKATKSSKDKARKRKSESLSGHPAKREAHLTKVDESSHGV